MLLSHAVTRPETPKAFTVNDKGSLDFSRSPGWSILLQFSSPKSLFSQAAFRAPTNVQLSVNGWPAVFSNE
jgi:hypothetical protein